MIRAGSFLPAKGSTFGEWTVLDAERFRRGGEYHVSCVCTCGAVHAVPTASLKSGGSRKCRSCNCKAVAKARRSLGVDVTYSKENRKLYDAWKNINARTQRPSCRGYKWYGARGITNEFASFAEFYEHVRSLPHYAEPARSIDRVDNDKPYAAGNLRWATRVEQARNTRGNHWVVCRGERMCLADFAAKLAPHLSLDVGRYRLVEQHMTPDGLLNTLGISA